MFQYYSIYIHLKHIIIDIINEIYQFLLIYIHLFKNNKI